MCGGGGDPGVQEHPPPTRLVLEPRKDPDIQALMPTWRHPKGTQVFGSSLLPPFPPHPRLMQEHREAAGVRELPPPRGWY